MTYALDTNIVILYLRNEPNVNRNFSDAITRGDDLVIPQIVNYEIRRGFRIVSAPKKEAAYHVLAYGPGFCQIAEMDGYCWVRAEQVYEEMYHKGLTIGELDILIAATCLENGYTLVTNNVKHFEDIAGLRLVNWAEE